eukprot:10909_1
MALIIRDLTASPGEKVSGMVTVNAKANVAGGEEEVAPIDIPVTIIQGINEADEDEHGPTVVILSGVHGSEYIPIMTPQKLARDMDPSIPGSFKGTLILVHIANIPSYFGRTVYNSPADGKNLNRVFPGKANGTTSEQIANFLVEYIYPHADYVIDMHSGDANEQLYPSYTAYYGKAGSVDVIDKSRDIAVAFGWNLTVEFQWELDGNMNNAIWAGSAAVVRNIPSIDVEVAPGMGTTHSYSIDQAYQGVLRVMIHLGMLQTMPEDIMEEKERQPPCIVKERYFIESPVRGSWTPLIDSGTYVTKGTSLGYITDLYGRNHIHETLAPDDGLLLIRFNTPPVLEGDTVAVVAVLDTFNDKTCESLKAEGMLWNTNGRIGVASNDFLVLWQWAAVTGWLVALCTFIIMEMKRRRILRGYQEQSQISTGHVQFVDHNTI